MELTERTTKQALHLSYLILITTSSFTRIYALSLIEPLFLLTYLLLFLLTYLLLITLPSHLLL